MVEFKKRDKFHKFRINSDKRRVKIIVFILLYIKQHVFII